MTYIKDHKVTYAVQKPSPNHGGVIDPKFIVMHYTAGFSAKDAVDILTRRGSRASAHVTVDYDGTVYQHVPYNTKAWHAGPSRYKGYSGLNSHSIGIEIVNPGWFRKDKKTYYRPGNSFPHSKFPNMVPHRNARAGSGMLWWPEYPEAQLKAVEALTKDIISDYGILDIVSHEEIDTRGWKTDPGPAFPMERFKSLLSASSNRDQEEDLHQVTASALNVRSGPGTEFDVINTLYRGNPIGVVSEYGDWAQVSINHNVDGWVHKAYLRPY